MDTDDSKGSNNRTTLTGFGLIAIAVGTALTLQITGHLNFGWGFSMVLLGLGGLAVMGVDLF